MCDAIAPFPINSIQKMMGTYIIIAAEEAVDSVPKGIIFPK